MKSSKIISTNDIKSNIKANLNLLGAALIFPLSFLAFCSLFLGISYSLPQGWNLVEVLKSFVLIIFSFFPLLAFVSVVNIFTKHKERNTILKSLLYVMPIISIVASCNSMWNLNISLDLFAALISSLTFILINNKWNIHESLWVLFGILLSPIFILSFILVNTVILNLGILISLLPLGLNSFAYGFTNRLLLPFGLHSLMIPMFAYSDIGGHLNIYLDGELVKSVDGDSMIWMTLYSNNIFDFSLNGTVDVDGVLYTYEVIGNNNPGQYQQGFLPMTSIAFPMIAITYCYFNSYEKGKVFLLGAILTCFSGITETTEYFFIMINPLLYLLNAFMVGISFMLCDLLNVNVWLSTGWSIDIILFGLIPWAKGFQTNWYYLIAIGFIVGVIYSSLFILIDRKTKYEL